MTLKARKKGLQHTLSVTFWNFLDEHGITRADDKRVGRNEVEIGRGVAEALRERAAHD